MVSVNRNNSYMTSNLMSSPKPQVSRFKTFLYLSIGGFAAYYALNTTLEMTLNTTVTKLASNIVSNLYEEKKQAVSKDLGNKITQVRQNNPSLDSVMLFINKYGAEKPAGEALHSGEGKNIKEIKGKGKGDKSAPSTAKAKPASEGNSAVAAANVSASQKAFTLKHIEAATRVQQDTLIPATFMIGQAGHETGWGKSEIISGGKQSYNLFGIKAGPGWNGEVSTIITTEYTNGVPKKVYQNFRAYNSYEDSFRDYAKLINNAPRYAKAKAAAREFAIEMGKSGYATDPGYAAKLERSINKADDSFPSQMIKTKTNP